MLKFSLIPVDVIVSKMVVGVAVAGLALIAGRQFVSGQDALIWSSAETGFVLEEISVTGRNRTSQRDLDTVLQVEDGMPILAVDLAELKERIERLPWVETAKVERHLPSRLEISLTEREPFAIWQIDGLVYIIDPKGHRIAPGSLEGFENLPFVVGKGANLEAPALVQSMAQLTALPVAIKSAVRVSNRRWDLHFENGIIVRLPEDGDDILALDTALERLIALDKEHQLLSREVATIDLRQPDRLVLALTDRGRRALAGKEWET